MMVVCCRACVVLSGDVFVALRGEAEPRPHMHVPALIEQVMSQAGIRHEPW